MPQAGQLFRDIARHPAGGATDAAASHATMTTKKQTSMTVRRSEMSVCRCDERQGEACRFARHRPGGMPSLIGRVRVLQSELAILASEKCRKPATSSWVQFLTRVEYLFGTHGQDEIFQASQRQAADAEVCSEIDVGGRTG
jgi:hypothetical protein